MTLRTLEKLLYAVGILLVVTGAFVKFILTPDSMFGLQLILGGHALGVAGIILYMKRANDLNQKHQAAQKPARQLKNN